MDGKFFKAFDEGTQSKLAIFTSYIRNWLPVFLSQQGQFNELIICDFFAGAGRDENGLLGSPLIIIEELITYGELIKKNKKRIKLILNEKCKPHFCSLEKEVNRYNELPCIVDLYNRDFINLFDELYPKLLSNKRAAKLIFIDQYGIKQVTNEIFSQLIQLSTCDLLFFTSSSFISRFGTTESFRKYFPSGTIDFTKISSYHAHRLMADYYRQIIPVRMEYYIAPFSIRKGVNIYGIIFGSHHTFGMEKFLEVCWNIDPSTGEANFDIDNDRINPDYPSLFEEFNIPNKIQLLERDLSKRLLPNSEHCLKDILVYYLNQGFLPKQVKAAIKKVSDDKRIIVEGFEKISRIHKLSDQEMIRITSKSRDGK